MVYLPGEDSFLIKAWVEEFAKGTVLDVGTGTGIQAITASKKSDNVIAVDIDFNALEYAKQQAEFQNIKNIEFRLGNLLEPIKQNEMFDLIIFNPPYLPESPYDKQPDTTGGKMGFETIVMFLQQASKHLKPKGKIIMVFSSYSKPDTILKVAKDLKYKHRLLQKKHIAFEDLFVYQFTL